MTKERWLFLLFIGVVLMILAFPVGKGSSGAGGMAKKTLGGEAAVSAKGADDASALAGQIPQSAAIAGRGNQSGGSGGGNGGGSTVAAGGPGAGGDRSKTGETAGGGSDGTDGGDTTAEGGQEDAAYTAAKAAGESAYEAQLEARVKEILRHVDGVGQVDVMIVLKSSEEKVLRVDRSTSLNDTKEQDSQGGTRSAQSSETQESTVLTGGGSGQGSVPFVEKELRPEISGIVVSATGGGSPTIKAEISAAMEALFDIPPHKIKVLKRVE